MQLTGIFRHILAVATLLLATAFSAMAQDTVHWLRFDVPPLFILDQSLYMPGFGDQSMQFVQRRLEGMHHEENEVTPESAFKMLRTGKHVGHPSMPLSKDREKHIAYSIPSQIIFPPHLVIRTTDLESFRQYMNGEGEISLRKMLEGEDKVLGYAHSRSYSATIDNILREHAGHPNVFSRSALNVAGGLMLMIHDKRIDCTLEFPVTGRYICQQNHLVPETFSYIPIEEMPPYIMTHFAFPKTEWGMEMVNKVNTILREHRTSDRFLWFYGQWLDAKTRLRYENLSRKVFQ